MDRRIFGIYPQLPGIITTEGYNMQTIAIKKIAFKAHNANAEFPCFNENYNEANKLGSRMERTMLRRISRDKHYGEERNSLTKKDVESYVFDGGNNLFRTTIV